MLKSALQSILIRESLDVLAKQLQHILSITCFVSIQIYTTLSSTWTIYFKVGVTKHLIRKSLSGLTKQVQHIYSKIWWVSKQTCNTLSSTWAVYVKVGVTKHFNTRFTRRTYKASTTHIIINLLSFNTDMQHTFVDLSGAC